MEKFSQLIKQHDHYHLQNQHYILCSNNGTKTLVMAPSTIVQLLIQTELAKNEESEQIALPAIEWESVYVPELYPDW